MQAKEILLQLGISMIYETLSERIFGMKITWCLCAAPGPPTHPSTKRSASSQEVKTSKSAVGIPCLFMNCFAFALSASMKAAAALGANT